MTREKPILMSAPMVHAILEGRKTQTRRVGKPDFWRCLDPGDAEDRYHALASCPYGQPGDRLWVRETFGVCSPAACDGMSDADFTKKRDAEGRLQDLIYAATAPEGFEWNDEPESRWRPSIHMPRWASRITLEVVSVRVEQLNDISEEDARAEGCDPYIFGHGPASALDLSCEPGMRTDCMYRNGFEFLWDSINAKRAPWSSNPWLWVVEFRKL